MKQNTRHLTVAAAIAALYVVLTGLSALLGLDKGAIQFRISEALTVLPCLTPAAIPGLAIGCALAGVLTAAMPLDVLFGSLATLLGALVAYALRRLSPWLAPLPNIVANTVIIPFVLSYVYLVPDGLPFLFLTVGIGEILSSGVLGLVLLFALRPHASLLFPFETHRDCKTMCKDAK